MPIWDYVKGLFVVFLVFAPGLSPFIFAVLAATVPANWLEIAARIIHLI